MFGLTSSWGSVLQNLWVQRPAEVPAVHPLEEIRLAMLEALGDESPPQAAMLGRRIRYAADVQRLWYLRPELMEAVAAARGEEAAREVLAAITPLFRTGLPQGLTHHLGARLAPR